MGYVPDPVWGAERAPADHAVERAFPRAPVLALIHPHVRAVALEALVDEDFLARRIRKADRRGLRALRERRLRDECGQHERERQFHRRGYVAQCPLMLRMAFLILLFCRAASADQP